MTDLISKQAAFDALMVAVDTVGILDAEDIKVVFDDFPTIDAVPVKCAKLVNPNPFGECSICGYLIDVREEYRYCPMCGAKMERSEDDKTAN